jgi:mono/diheme cytochrome c family protein
MLACPRIIIGLALLLTAAACGGTAGQGDDSMSFAASASGELRATPAARSAAIPTLVPTTGPLELAAPPVAPTPTALVIGSQQTEVSGSVATPTQVPNPAITPTEVPVPVAPESSPVPTAAAPTVAPTTAVPTTAVPTTAGTLAIDIANGAEGYAVSCARCHSKNGLGTFIASGLIGAGARYSRGSLVAELTNGHAFTFGFADQLSSDEIAAIATFVVASF